MTSSRSYRRAL